MIRKKTVPFHLQAIDDKTGEFTGYASVFETVDFYGDVIKPGAFKNTLAKWKDKGKLPPILWQHRSDAPLGPHLEMREDEKGLYVRGRLLIDDVAQAREAHALLKSGTISGMSIGFDVFPDGAKYEPKGEVWNLTDLDLWENSLVTFPANPDAQVENVKSILDHGKLPVPSDFEKFLRDAGFSRSRAKFITSHGYTGLRDANLPLRDAEGEDVTESQKGLDLSPILLHLQRK